MKELFRRIAERTAAAMGSPTTFIIVLAGTILWLGLGPLARFSDAWQLTMNTFSSQVTFLVALLLQNTQSRDTRALQLKLDELLRATDQARNELIHLEHLSDAQLGELETEFTRLRQRRAGHENPGATD